MHGILPACECLESADFTRHRTDLRLIVDLDVALDQRLLEIADDVAAEVQLLLHRWVELRPHRIVGVLDAVAGDLRAVHDERDILHILRRTVDARLDLHRQSQIIDADPLVNELDAVAGVLDLRRHSKVIVVEACDEIPLERLTQKISDVAQQTVSLLKAVPLIKTLEILNIEIDKNQRLCQFILQMYRRMAHKLHHVEESGHLAEITFSVLFQQNEPPISLHKPPQKEIRANSSTTSRRLMPLVPLSSPPRCPGADFIRAVMTS